MQKVINQLSASQWLQNYFETGHAIEVAGLQAQQQL
jgi:hypothetical protein